MIRRLFARDGEAAASEDVLSEFNGRRLSTRLVKHPSHYREIGEKADDHAKDHASYYARARNVRRD